MMKDRLEEQFAWRKEQLEREVAILTQRKDAIVVQMGNLRQLAEDASVDFPNTDPFDAAAEPTTVLDAQPTDPDVEETTVLNQDGRAHQGHLGLGPVRTTARRTCRGRAARRSRPPRK